MRTTLQIDDDVLEAAKSLARSQNTTAGAVVSALARKGLQPAAPRHRRRGFPVFSVSAKAQPLSPETVARALDDE